MPRVRAIVWCVFFFVLLCSSHAKRNKSSRRRHKKALPTERENSSPIATAGVRSRKYKYVELIQESTVSGIIQINDYTWKWRSKSSPVQVSKSSAGQILEGLNDTLSLSVEVRPGSKKLSTIFHAASNFSLAGPTSWLEVLLDASQNLLILKYRTPSLVSATSKFALGESIHRHWIKLFILVRADVNGGSSSISIQTGCGQPQIQDITGGISLVLPKDTTIEIGGKSRNKDTSFSGQIRKARIHIPPITSTPWRCDVTHASKSKVGHHKKRGLLADDPSSTARSETNAEPTNLDVGNDYEKILGELQTEIQACRSENRLMNSMMQMMKQKQSSLEARISSLESCECIPMCVMGDGIKKRHGEIWTVNDCTTCQCTNGESSCERREGCDDNITVCSSNPCENGGVCEEAEGTFSCRCRRGFYGPQCEFIDKCIRGVCQNGAECDRLEDGGYRCRCKTGFTGRNCERNPSRCSSEPCLNDGVCIDTTSSYICRCRDGFRGRQCQDRDDCFSNPCLNGGVCTSLPLGSYICRCPSGFLGTKCELRDVCFSSPCLNGGRCVRGTDDLDYTCECLEPFQGPRCQHRNPCYRNPCMNGGRCVSDALDGGSFACQCEEGFSGHRCQDEDVCFSDPCKNGGRCIAGRSTSNAEFDFTCKCPEWYIGPRCEFRDSCYSSPCLNGGDCLALSTPNADGTLQYSCRCPESHYGDRCELRAPCADSPCQNDGVCENRPSGEFNCRCRATHYGTHCEFTDYCRARPCQNGATCLNKASKYGQPYTCECTEPFMGTLCEDQDLCRRRPCLNGGTCRMEDGDYECTCQGSFYGKRCEKSDFCAENPCLNGGRCENDESGVGFRCICPGTHTGRRCQDRHPCRPNPCLNNGRCRVSRPGAYACECPPSHRGPNCRLVDYCRRNPCLNGGTCLNDRNTFRCDCRDGYSGDICEEITACSSNPCRNGATCIEERGRYRCICPDTHSGNRCEYACNVCAYQKDVGFCEKPGEASQTTRWYFDKNTQKCMTFRYSGCGGNGNNFATRQACRQKCLVGACCSLRQSMVINGHSSPPPPAYSCQTLSVGQCKRRDSQYTEVQVVSFKPGVDCADDTCGTPSKCSFAGKEYLENTRINVGCAHSCMCRPGGNMRCTCRQKSLRREIRRLTTDERLSFQDAVRTLKTREFEQGRTVWDTMRDEYVRSLPIAQSSRYFLLWNRAFVRKMELSLQGVDCAVNIPYYDFTQDAGSFGDAIVWQPNYFGGDGDCVPDHPFRVIVEGEAYPWVPCVSRTFNKSVGIPSMIDVASALSSRTYEQLSGRLLTLVSHVHAFIGGDMATTTKAYDPLFYSIHAYIDYIFQTWQDTHPASNDVNLVRGVDSIPFGMSPEDIWNGACVQYADFTQRIACNRSDVSEEIFAEDGYNLQGYDRQGFDRDGYDKHGYNALGRNSYGNPDTRGLYKYDNYDAEGYLRTGYDRRGYNRFGFHRNGRNRDGFDSRGFDEAGFSRYGLDEEGYDRRGFNLYGLNRYGSLDDSEHYDVETGFNDCCFGRDGLTPASEDRFGFDVEGYDSQSCEYFFNGPHTLHYREKLWTMLSPQRASFLSTLPRTCGPLENLPRSKISLNWVSTADYPRTTGLDGSVQTQESKVERTNQAFSDRYCFDVDMLLTWCPCSDENYPALCTTNPCAGAYCTLHPNARCVINMCGRTCTAEFFLDGRRVNCDNPCDPNPCQHGGTCEPSKYTSDSERFQCICPDEYVGTLCEKPAPDTCMLSKKVGNCQASVTRWYYNFATASCEEFTYSGCGGNTNNFRSKKACDLRCSLGACCYRLPRNSTFLVGFDRDGFDKYGFNALGFNRRGQQQSAHDSMPTGNRIHPPKGYGHDGYDIYGYDHDGYDRQGYDRNGFHRDTGFNRKGFNEDGDYDELREFDNDGYNPDGFDRAGYTCSGVDTQGFNQLGLYYDFEYHCESLLLTECEALKDPQQLEIPFEVISFAPGSTCDEVKCGEDCGCNVDGEIYRFGETFQQGCEQCTCTLGGVVECSCQRLGRRREIRDLSEEERELYASAIRKLYKSNKWEEFATQHAQYMPQSNGVPSSLPWHRYFLKMIEKEIQKHSSCEVFIPYFDWTIDVGKMEDSQVWQASFMGGDGEESTNCVHHHPFMLGVRWHPCIKRKFAKTISLPDAVNFHLLLQEDNYEDFRLQLEMMSALFHLWVGGHMASPFSPYDPLYLSHWAFMDHIWAEWQKKNPMGVARFPAQHRYLKMMPFVATPDNVLSSEQQMCVIYIPPTLGSPCNVTNPMTWPPSVRDQDGLDRHGLDENGYDVYGYNVEGVHRSGRQDERNIFDENGFDSEGYHRSGFDSSGWDKYDYNKFNFNRDGFDIERFDASGYDRYGYDRDGKTPYGMYRNMTFALGFDSGYATTLFDRYGYNKYGFDKNGFDRTGHDVFGFNLDGLDEDRCDYYFDGPHYLRYFFHVDEQLSALGKSMLRNIKRICPPITRLPAYYASHIWLDMMPKARNFERKWSQDHPVDVTWQPRTSSVTPELLWLPITPDQQFCFDIHWFSGCPLGTKLMECVEDPCAKSSCASHPHAQCRTKNCGACYPEFYNGKTGEIYQCYGCVAKSGETQNEGSTWLEGCNTCVCQAGLISCSPQPCPSHSCTHPAPGPDGCCEVCNSCEFENRIYQNQEKFRPNACEICDCIDGSVMCQDIVTNCPPLSCQSPVKLPGECCPTCTTDCQGHRNRESWAMDKCNNCSCVDDTIVCRRNPCPVLQCRHPRTSAGECCPECMGCEYKGKKYRHSQNFMENSCSQCSCRFGTVTCTTQQCPPLTCKHKERPAGSCCPRCRKGCEYEGTFYDNGVSFTPQNNPCLTCSCQDGQPRCSRMTCPRVSCLRPIVPDGQCCPQCATCQKGEVVYNEGQMWTSDDKCKKCVCRRGEEVCRNIIPCRDQCSYGILLRGQCCPDCSRCSYHGKIFQHLEPFTDPRDPCRSCTCQRGNVVCSTTSCPEVRCSVVETPVGECCPRCKSCVFDGALREHGSSWRIPDDPCTTCSCQEGSLECTEERCPPARCDNPSTPDGSCCPTCNGCFYRGRNYDDGDTVEPGDRCSTCSCLRGNVVCREKPCPEVTCSSPVRKSGECCPSCTTCQYEGRTYQDEAVFLAPRSPCLECTCQGGQVDCRRLDLECKRPLCTHPGRNRTYCCPSCNSCEYERRMYSNGETFSPNPASPCVQCNCTNGNVRCTTEDCPGVSCPNPVRKPGECCPVCEECVQNGRRYSNRERWMSDSCTNCECTAGNVQCNPVSCPLASCNHPAKSPGECCPTCDKCLYEGQVYLNGRQFQSSSDRCRTCTCRDGTVTCSRRACPALDCTNSRVEDGACCPSCPTECQFRGRTIANGGTIPHPDDNCRECLCTDGSVTCRRRDCPASVSCTHPTSDGCCRVVCDNCLYKGKVVGNGESVRTRDPCRTCTCTDGSMNCIRQRCPRDTCDNPKMTPGKCCPDCPKPLEGCQIEDREIAHGEQGRMGCKMCSCSDGELSCHPPRCSPVNCSAPVKHECCLSCNHGCSVDGKTYEDGEEIIGRNTESCNVCHCKKGNVECKKRSCQDVDCPNPKSDGCCPACDGCTYDGDDYEDGTSFPDPSNTCGVCSCDKGSVTCSLRDCRVPCTHPAKPEGACCPVCGGDCLREGRVYSQSQGMFFLPEDEHQCKVCVCDAGSVLCTQKPCPISNCKHPITNTCGCAMCDGGCLFNGIERSNRETFPNPDNEKCSDCYCSNGNVVCGKRTCEPSSCTHPAKNDCDCPRCDQCLYFGRIYNTGASFDDATDSCNFCQCQDGNVECRSRACPVVSCSHPVIGPCGCRVCTGCTYGGVDHEDQERFEDPSNKCNECVCQAGGVLCTKVTCPILPCASPVLADGECCPKCIGMCNIEGRSYENGATFTLQSDSCSICSCASGEVRCVRQRCDVRCTNPITQSECCPDCSACLHLGVRREEGESFTPSDGACRQCQCIRGNVVCASKACPEVECENPRPVRGSCCPKCPEPHSRECIVNGRMLSSGDNWIERDESGMCEECTCLEGATISCAKAVCENSCTHPVPRLGKCCASCGSCYYGNRTYKNGAMFQPNECKDCACANGNVRCVTKACSPLSCSADKQIKVPGECCPRCKSCVMGGKVYSDHQSWTSPDDPCQECHCYSGVVTCAETQCLHPCRMMVQMPGQCCPVCAGCIYNSKVYQVGERFSPNPVDPCEVCDCLSSPTGAPVMCCKRQQCPSLADCPRNCIRQPRPGQCCPTCTNAPGCAYGHCSARSQGSQIVPTENRCFACDCQVESTWLCMKERCGGLSCPRVRRYTPQGSCCPVCDQCHLEMENIDVPDGKVWRRSPCEVCRCEKGRVVCVQQSCPPLPLNCQMGSVPYTRPGQCCQECLNADAPCVYEGQNIMPHHRWKPDQCTSCKCFAGKVECTTQKCRMLMCHSDQAPTVVPGECCPKCMPRPASCVAFGDPHYKTFDGRMIHFQGTCQYLLTADCSQSDFKVFVHNSKNSGTSRRVSWTERVTIVTEGGSVALMKDYSVRVNGTLIRRLPISLPPHFYIEAAGNYMMLRTHLGVQLSWNGRERRLEVTVPGTYKRRTCGLCGNLNNYPQDDWRLQNGRMASSDSEFGNNWKVNLPNAPSCPDADEISPCNGVNYAMRTFANEKCKVLRSPTFAACHALVNPEVYFATCVYDVCACQENDQSCLCDVLEAYAAQCRRSGVAIRWRSPTLCAFACPYDRGYVFDECGSPCKRTCANRNLPPGAIAAQCYTPCVSGCQCPAGKVEHGGRCIYPEHCPAQLLSSVQDSSTGDVPTLGHVRTPVHLPTSRLNRNSGPVRPPLVAPQSTMTRRHK